MPCEVVATPDAEAASYEVTENEAEADEPTLATLIELFELFEPAPAPIVAPPVSPPRSVPLLTAAELNEDAEMRSPNETVPSVIVPPASPLGPWKKVFETETEAELPTAAALIELLLPSSILGLSNRVAVFETPGVVPVPGALLEVTVTAPTSTSYVPSVDLSAWLAEMLNEADEPTPATLIELP